MLAKQKRLALLCLLIVGLPLILAGCFTVNPSINGSGQLKVTINIPQELLPKFVSHTVTLSTVHIAVTNGSNTSSQTINVSGGSVEAVFNDLTTGEWTVNVDAVDTEGFTAYKGQNTVYVQANTLSPAFVQLSSETGDLTVNVTMPAGVSSGKISLANLTNPAARIEQWMSFSGNVGTVTFIGITATTWPMEIVLFDSMGYEMKRATSYVDVLPGRTSTASVQMDSTTGGIDVSIGWELPPAAPTGLTAYFSSNGVELLWNMNTEGDLAGYLVFRSTSLDGVKTCLTNSLQANTTYTDYTAEQGKSYYYWIQAIDTLGFSSSLSTHAYVGAPIAPAYQIMFNSNTAGSEDIYTVNPDGSNLRVVTDNSMDNDWFGAYSPDGTKIAYVSTNAQIFVINADGTNRTQLTFDGYHNKRNLHWSPNGAKILYEAEDDAYKTEIFTVDYYSGTINRLTFNTAMEWDSVWSPDGTKIAYTSNSSGLRELWVMNADGTGAINLTPIQNFEACPVWSPDGTKIMYLVTENGFFNMWVINVNGSNPLRLTNGSLDEAEGQWSLDGSKIVYSSNQDGDWEIYVMNADGSNPVQLTHNTSIDDAPAWTPDGQKIVFFTDRDGNNEIYIMNADGTGQLNVTNLPGTSETMFSVSPLL